MMSDFFFFARFDLTNILLYNLTIIGMCAKCQTLPAQIKDNSSISLFIFDIENMMDGPQN